MPQIKRQKKPSLLTGGQNVFQVTFFLKSRLKSNFSCDCTLISPKPRLRLYKKIAFNWFQKKLLGNHSSCDQYKAMRY